jgi:polyisoprenoid-binding protein YceI
MNIRNAILLTALIALPSLAQASATHYEIDSTHSAVQFKVRHLVSHVPGSFRKFKGTFDYDPADPKASKAVIEIEASSIDTGNTKRDEHLKSADFFDVKKYPTLKFESTELKDVTDGKARLAGNLTMHGVTKPVILELEIGGEAADPWGSKRAGFTGSTKVDRKDYGLTWNKALETGKLLVGDEVTIDVSVEGIAKTDAKTDKK